MKRFIHETEVYSLLKNAGMHVPRHGAVKGPRDIDELPFTDGDPVVVKGLGYNLWHKSDQGALHFTTFSKQGILKLHEQMKAALAGTHDLVETLVCERVAFREKKGIPSEGFVSIQRDPSAGLIISFGIGGLHAEAWAQELRSNILMWSPSISTPETALDDVKRHWIGKVWLGQLRQATPLTDEATLLHFLKGLWSMAATLDEKHLALLEMNPIVVDENGHIVALDGVGETAIPHPHVASRPIDATALLTPQSIAIAGVSTRMGSFGRLIFENLLKSRIPKNKLTVIKPGESEFMGVHCVPDVAALMHSPVDALIVSLPAPAALDTIKNLCLQGGGASVVYIVSGGLGDGADKQGLGNELTTFIDNRRRSGHWTPNIVGPNSLGIVLSPLHLNTQFLPTDRLRINFNDQGHIGFVSQSGAFFVVNFSNEEHLPIKYAYCIGNQMDVKVSDFLDAFSSDSSIRVAATYIEGFSEGEVLRYAEKARALIQKGVRVILYKGGRSDAGQKAAAGHTGAMAGNFALQKKVLSAAGVLIAETIDDFTAMIKWPVSKTPVSFPLRIGVVTNAGFECVASADNIGSVSHLRVASVTEGMKRDMNTLIDQHGLVGLVSPGNPFDLTPTASDRAYLEGTRIMAQNAEIDAVIVGMVPITERMVAFDRDRVKEIALEYRTISEQSGKPVVISINAGPLYTEYKDIFRQVGLPVYHSIEVPLLALARTLKAL